MTHEDCSLCQGVPDRCWEERRGHEPGELVTDPLPAAIARFVTHGRYGNAFLRCPVCGTCYRREHDVESFANGPNEEVTTIVRLTPKEAAAALAKLR